MPQGMAVRSPCSWLRCFPSSARSPSTLPPPQNPLPEVDLFPVMSSCELDLAHPLPPPRLRAVFPRTLQSVSSKFLTSSQAPHPRHLCDVKKCSATRPAGAAGTDPWWAGSTGDPRGWVPRGATGPAGQYTRDGKETSKRKFPQVAAEGLAW